MTRTFLHRFVLLSVLLPMTVFASVLKVQFSSEPTRYDPLLMEDGTALRLAANVIATPLEYDGAGVLKNSLIKEFRFSPDHRKMLLRFREGMKWSDGVPFHADQFIFAIQRLVNEPIKPALAALTSDFNLEKTRAVDANTAEIVLRSPDPLLPIWLTLPSFAPVRKEFLKEFSKRNPVLPTLAAYQVTEYKRESHLILKKNPLYHDSGSVQIVEVFIRFLKDDAVLQPLLRTGELDILCKVPPLHLDAIRKIAKVTEVPVEAVTYLGFNVRKGPFQNLSNRKAFLKGIASKRGELARILQTGELSADTLLPRMMIPSGAGLDHGWSDSWMSVNEPVNRKLEFNAQTDGGSRNEVMLQYLQGVLKARFSWSMKIENLDWKMHYSRLKTDPEPVFRFGWQNPVSDPYVTYQMLKSDSPNNLTGWKNVEYDRLVNELRQTTKTGQRAKLVGKLERILMQEVPVVPVLHQVLRFANSKRVTGFRANPFGVFLFRELRIAKN
jgi:ABC-type transport system substrate-binding protein